MVTELTNDKVAELQGLHEQIMVPKAGDQAVASIEGDINITEQIKIKDASTFKLRTKKSPLMLESGM